MKLRHTKLFTAAIAVVLVLFSSLCPAYAAEDGAGTTTYQNRIELGGGVTYTNTISQNPTYGIQQSHSFTTTPGDIVTPIILACDTIYGSMNIDSIVSYAQKQGYNVVAAMNTDFFSMSTGVPLGIVIENGIYKCSPEGYPSVLFDHRGSASVVENTAVQIKMTNQGGGEGVSADTERDAEGNIDGDSPLPQSNAGKFLTLTHFNKMRQNGAGMYLMDEHFSTVSTRTSSPGWAVKFKILEGTMKTKGTMRLEVVETYEGSAPMTIGAGYMVLTADDKSNLHYQFEKFLPGDEVILETSCYGNAALENAQWGTGAGNVIVKDGAVTPAAGWDSALLYKNPRSALGIKADGTVVYYELDGRQPGYSNGISMKQLAQEFIDQGCITAVNFDGGGSSAIAAKLPGSSSVKVLSSPSDGALRKCATYVLLVSKAVSDGIPNVLTLDQAGAVVYQGASVDLSYKALDKGNGVAAAPSDVTAEVSDGYGTIQGNTYTAGWVPGMETISLNSPSQGISGSSSVYVTNRLSDISVKADGRAVSSLNVEKGQKIQFSQTAVYNGKNVVIGPKSYQYTLTGDPIGTISDTGLLTISDEAHGSAVVNIASGGVVKKINITVNGVFADIGGHWAESYITELFEKGIVGGTGEGKFSPESNIKRADFMVMLHRAAGSPTAAEEKGQSVDPVAISDAAVAERDDDMLSLQGNTAGDDFSDSFADVPEDAYYAEAVKWAKSLGIAKGDGINFHPVASMTRQDAFCFLHRYLTEKGAQLTEPSEDALSDFSDSGEIAEYAKGSTAVLTASGIVNGSGGKIRPLGMLTRAEMCKIFSVSLTK